MAEVRSIKKFGHRESCVWYVGPTYKQVKRIAWNVFKRMIPREALYKKPNETDLNFIGRHGGELWLMGADEPDSLRGPAPTHLVLEEAAQMKPETWYEVLFPNLAAKRATTDFIGTPKGFNWFKDLWDKALKDPATWATYHRTIYDNPHISRDEIELHKRNCPNDRVWRQEYLAEFESDVGRVFTFESRELFQKLPWPEKHAICFRGIDWGMRDQTVCLWGRILRTGSGLPTLHVFMEHAQANLPATSQAGLIKNLSQDLRCEMTALSHDAFRQDPDMRGISVAWHFVRAGVTPVVPSSRNKREAINMIQTLMTEKRILIDIEKCPVLQSQLQSLEWKDTLLEKAEDGNDDAVDALCYLVYMLASRLMLPGEKSDYEKRDPNKLYLPSREAKETARFTSFGDVVGAL